MQLGASTCYGCETQRSRIGGEGCQAKRPSRFSLTNPFRPFPTTLSGSSTVMACPAFGITSNRAPGIKRWNYRTVWGRASSNSPASNRTGRSNSPRRVCHVLPPESRSHETR